jgi:glucosamine-6-phosphate deaminase
MSLIERVRYTHIELTSAKAEIPLKEYDTPREAARAAAQRILATIIHNPEASIMFATGNTMIPVYEELVSLINATGVDATGIQAYHLDEYDGVAPTDAESFVGYLRKRVFDPLGIPEANRHEMRGDTGNSPAEAARYNEEVNRKPMDLVILGIGPGGHIGFNEPGTPFAKQTHLAPLSTGTVQRDQLRGQRPLTHALTVGIANILKAKEVVMIGYGKEKGKEFARAMHQSMTENCPASALQRIYDRVTIIADREAGSVARAI